MTEGRKLDLEINGRRYSVQVKNIDSDRATVLVNDTKVEVNILGKQKDTTATPKSPGSGNVTAEQHEQTPAKSAISAQKQSSPKSSANSLQAVMPGVVTKVLASEGQQVKAGDVLLIIEAMKMENEIRAPKEATISKILVEQGDKVLTGDTMILFN